MKRLDPENMLAHIDGLPEQLMSAWKLGLTLPLPAMKSINRLVVAGMGGSAIGADLVASCLSDRLLVPMSVQRDYGLPAYARGSDTLVVISSHSGNTEESNSAYEQACLSGCQVVVVSTGGKLRTSAESAGFPVWIFNHIRSTAYCCGVLVWIAARASDEVGVG